MVRRRRRADRTFSIADFPCGLRKYLTMKVRTTGMNFSKRCMGLFRMGLKGW